MAVGVGGRPSASGGTAERDPAIRTFLFTDIEGSTGTWQSSPDGMSVALDRHDTILRLAVEAHHGTVVKHTGDGVVAAFEAPRSALSAAVDAQRELLSAVPFTVRMAIATGEARPRDDDWFGPGLNLCARLLDAGHGGQVLVAAATAQLLSDVATAGMALLDLGEHRLRGLADPQRIFQLLCPGLPERHPPLRTAAAPVHTLPATRTRLVGREAEMVELVGLLPSVRLLTITGVGGVGKTRLALELAGSVLERYPGGTFFAELAAVVDGPGVGRTLAAAVGLERGGPVPGDSALEQLLSFLASRTALIVMDNCEHLLDECADLIDVLLDRCGQLTVIATSREPLGVDGERVWRAPSMTVTGPGSDAVQLFIERATAAGMGVFRPAEIAAATEICRRLDGIPLAIELAAAQAAHLSVAEVASRLDDRFALLTGRRRVQRQQTLLAAVDWSHDLLTEPERLLFRRLAVFPGWFSLQGVEAVCADGLNGTVQLLGSLVAKSLVVADDGRRGLYRLLETMRLYGEDRLVAAGEAESLRQRHRDWVFDEVQRRAGDHEATLDAAERLAEVADDLRAALRWSVAHGDLRAAALANVNAGAYWFYAGLSDEQLEWFDATEGAELSEDERAAQLTARAGALILSGDLDQALRTADRVAELQPDPASHSRVEADVFRALLLLRTEPMRAVALCDDVLARTDPGSFHGRMATELRGHHTLALDPEAAIVEWERLLASADARRRGMENFSVLFDLGVAYHLVGRHAGSLDMAHLLDRWGFSVGRTFHTYGAQFLRTLAYAGLGDLHSSRAHAVAMTEGVRRTAGALQHKDCALACTALAAASGDLELAALLLGAIRGDRSQGLSLRTPPAFALYRHYRNFVSANLPGDVTRELLEQGRSTDLASLADRVLAS